MTNLIAILLITIFGILSVIFSLSIFIWLENRRLQLYKNFIQRKKEIENKNHFGSAINRGR